MALTNNSTNQINTHNILLKTCDNRKVNQRACVSQSKTFAANIGQTGPITTDTFVAVIYNLPEDNWAQSKAFNLIEVSHH